MQEPDGFSVILQEPESGQEALYHTNFHDVLTQDELMFESEHGSFRNKIELKRLAKKLLEERVEIKRLQDDESNV